MPRRRGCTGDVVHDISLDAGIGCGRGQIVGFADRVLDVQLDIEGQVCILELAFDFLCGERLHDEHLVACDIDVHVVGDLRNVAALLGCIAEYHVVVERDFCKRLAIGITDAHKTVCIRCGKVCKVGFRDLVNDRQALFAFLDGVDIELVCKCGVLAVCP